MTQHITRLSCSQCEGGNYGEGTGGAAQCAVCGHEVTPLDFDLYPGESLAFRGGWLCVISEN